MRLTHAVELLGSALLGVSFVLAVYSLRSTVGTILVLLLPLAVICLWAAVAQGAPGISSLLRSAAWWQWLWLLLFLSDFTFRQRTSGEIQENPLDAWAAYRVALVATTAVVLAIRLALRTSRLAGFSVSRTRRRTSRIRRYLCCFNSLVKLPGLEPVQIPRVSSRSRPACSYPRHSYFGGSIQDFFQLDLGAVRPPSGIRLAGSLSLACTSA